MNDLPSEVSLLFITYEKMTSNKADILEFCDSIQDLVSTMNEETKAPSTSDLACVQLSLESSQLNRMEIAESEQSELSCGEGPSRGVIPKRGRDAHEKMQHVFQAWQVFKKTQATMNLCDRWTTVADPRGQTNKMLFPFIINNRTILGLFLCLFKNTEIYKSESSSGSS